MSDKLIAIDPGETTGVAFFENSILISTTVVRSLLDLYNTLNAFRPDFIAMEMFRLYPHRTAAKTLSGFPEVERIGVVRLYAELHSLPLTEELASAAKTAFNDNQLKALKLWRTVTHERDAIRHGLLFLSKRKSIQPVRRKVLL